ncbi:DUF1127 domain-containing protein [Tabrizicola aquatica]|uniref:DUF1127 domain-containing protein n=1 Tax=Tabrizicola aquatica TaxID=909926 RepID=UPI0015E15F2B|nr:DUF1127 domain-containing protein [Tabrizicola aquatica]
MWSKLKEWWATEGALVQLSGLDDRLLADMGLEREALRARVTGEAEARATGARGAVVCEGCQVRA